MLKRFCVLAVIGLLIGCRSTGITSTSGLSDSVSDIDEATFSGASFRVGVLLPLSGEAAKHGQGLKNAALMAYDDMKNDALLLQFYDTQSTHEGARAAAEKAIQQKVQMIVGPLTSSEVSAVSAVSRNKNIPVVAFSTNSAVLQNQVYTLGLLVEEQVNRIVSYAAKKNRSKFALLLPDNSTGFAVARAALAAAYKNNAEIVRIAFYDPQSSDFSGILKELTNFEKRAEPVRQQKAKLKTLAQNGNVDAKRELKKIENKETDFGVDFDAVLIPESGSKLKSIAAMFGYYDVFSPEVKFLGTTVWENTNLSKESTLIGSWFPALSRNHNAYFNKKYNALFGKYPTSLYAFAYDAVALSSVIAKQRPADINAAVTNPDGFVGISGVFRINADGKNEHSLDIMQITSSGDVVVDMASKKFSFVPDGEDSADIASLYDGKTILIFGKDPVIAQKQIFGRQLKQPVTSFEGDTDEIMNYFHNR